MTWMLTSQKPASGQTAPSVKARIRQFVFASRLQAALLALALMWTVLVAAALGWSLHREDQLSIATARIAARMSFEKDVIYRRWMAAQGGVYVTPSARTPPNPHLQVPHRDLMTTNGQALTLVNPAYMTRQAHDLEAKEYGLRGHITSLQPLRPENAADAWETNALRSFTSLSDEASSIETVRGAQYLRLMRPLLIETGCLKCHDQHGERLGDVRGGISAAVPMAPLWALARSRKTTLTAGFGGIWLIGLAGLGLGGRHLRQRMAERDHAVRELTQSNERLNATAAQIKELMRQVAEQETFTARFVNPNLGRCWELKNCQRIDCPAYGNETNLRCWEQAGTYYQAGAPGACAPKLDNCRQCEVFLNARPNAVMEMGETFNEMIAMSRERQAALHESEEKHRLLYTTSREAIMTLAPPDWRFTAGNPATVAMFGARDEAEFCATGLGKRSPERQAGGELSSALALQMIETAMKNGSHLFEWTHCRLNGENFPATVLLTRVEAGSHTFLQATVRDITQCQQAEKERHHLEIQLRQANKLESIGQLAAGIAHEINTPMQFIGDNTRFAREGFREMAGMLRAQQRIVDAVKIGPVEPNLMSEVEAIQWSADLDYFLEEIPKAIDQSLEGVQRVAAIVRAMKEFSRPGAAEKAPTDLAHAIETTLTVASNEWGFVAEVVKDFDPHLPPVPCLPGELNQVILNLVINAAHAIGDKLGDGGNGKGVITVSTHRDGDWAEARISDTGNGIPEAIQSKIFDPFFTTKEVGKGTGQGLAIAWSVIVEKHGGHLDFETRLGQGTTFVIRLPLNPTSVAVQKAAA